MFNFTQRNMKIAVIAETMDGMSEKLSSCKIRVEKMSESTIIYCSLKEDKELSN